MSQDAAQRAEMGNLDRAKDWVARHGGDQNTVIALTCLLDAAVAEAVKERDAGIEILLERLDAHAEIVAEQVAEARREEQERIKALIRMHVDYTDCLMNAIGPPARAPEGEK